MSSIFFSAESHQRPSEKGWFSLAADRQLNINLFLRKPLGFSINNQQF
jgi:hypothetical protein